MNHDSVGRLTNPKAWSDELPPSVFAGLSQWIKGQSFDLLHRRWLTHGKSGSFVASVQLQRHRGMLTGAILKVLPKELATRESRAVKLADECGPKEFVDAHITPTTWIGPLPGISGSWLHLQEVAQSGSARMLLLSELVDDAQLGGHCEAILLALATEWNTGVDDPKPMITTPNEFLRTDLGEKLVGLRRLAAHARWDFDKPTELIQLPGRPDPLPNPLRLLRPANNNPKVTVYRGKGHGDLHVENILVPVSGNVVDPSRFRLIDIGRFAPDMPVSRDPAKLMLSLAANWLPGLAPQSAIRSSLAELVVAPEEFPSSPPIDGYLHVARQIERAASLWAVRRGLVADWPEQHRLVLAAAALRTAARDDVPEPDRWWHLEVAALALRSFLPALDGRVASVPPPTPPTARRNQPVANESISGAPLAPMSRIAIRDDFGRILGADWQDLADILEIPPQERARLPQGDEPRYIWEWLEVRGKIDTLRTALTNIGRDDLALLIEQLESG